MREEEEICLYKTRKHEKKNMESNETKENKITPKLWTRNFLILSLGSLVSIAGANIVVIVFGLIILDLTESGFFYSLLLAIGNLAGVMVPILVGARMEKWEKQKVIYILDFSSAAVFLLLALVSYLELLSPETILIGAFIFQTISVIYQTAYNSYLPAVVGKESYTKAYSVDSIINNFAEASFLVGIFGYEYFGATQVLLFASICFFVAACFETQLKPARTQTDLDSLSIRTIRGTAQSYKAVWGSMKKIIGFRETMICFMADWFRTGAFWAMILPFFEYIYPYDTVFGITIEREYLYVVILAFYSIGQFWGGTINYGMKIKKDRRLLWHAFFTIGEIGGLVIFPFLPMISATILLFMSGICSIFTYCGYETILYEWVPETMRARFTGLLNTIIALLMIAGNLIGGWIVDYFPNPAWGFLLTSLPQVFLMAALMALFLPRLKSFFGGENNTQNGI